MDESEIDVSGWPYTGEQFESDYGFSSACTCSKCMNGYYAENRIKKAQHDKYAPHYTEIKRPLMRTQTIGQRLDDMYADQYKTFNSWPYFQREPAVADRTIAEMLSNVNFILVVFFILVVLMLYQAKNIIELKSELKRLKKV